MSRIARRFFAHIQANLFCLWRSLRYGEIWQVMTGAFLCPCFEQCKGSHLIKVVGAISKQGDDIKSELFYRWEEGGQQHVER